MGEKMPAATFHKEFIVPATPSQGEAENRRSYDEASIARLVFAKMEEGKEYVISKQWTASPESIFGSRLSDVTRHRLTVTVDGMSP